MIGDLGFTKNYRGITRTAAAAKVHNALLLNLIYLKSRKFLEKIRTVLEEINPQPQRFWLSIESSKEYVQKISKQQICQ